MSEIKVANLSNLNANIGVDLNTFADPIKSVTLSKLQFRPGETLMVTVELSTSVERLFIGELPVENNHRKMLVYGRPGKRTIRILARQGNQNFSRTLDYEVMEPVIGSFVPQIHIHRQPDSLNKFRFSLGNLSNVRPSINGTIIVGWYIGRTQIGSGERFYYDFAQFGLDGKGVDSFDVTLKITELRVQNRDGKILMKSATLYQGTETISIIHENETLLRQFGMGSLNAKLVSREDIGVVYGMTTTRVVIGVTNTLRKAVSISENEQRVLKAGGESIASGRLPLTKPVRIEPGQTANIAVGLTWRTSDAYCSLVRLYGATVTEGSSDRTQIAVRAVVEVPLPCRLGMTEVEDSLATTVSSVIATLPRTNGSIEYSAYEIARAIDDGDVTLSADCRVTIPQIVRPTSFEPRNLSYVAGGVDRISKKESKPIKEGDIVWSPDDPSDEAPAGYHFVRTSNKKTKTMVRASYLANAYKGDVILSCFQGMIGNLLRSVEPPQIYSHSGIVVRDHDLIRHCTSLEAYLTHNGDYSPTDGWEPDRLKYLWPGTITQTIEAAYEGESRVGPDGKTYTLEQQFNFASSYFPGNAIVEPLIVRPPWELEAQYPEVRERLHQLAERATSIKAHYRLYCYTKPELALYNTSKAPSSAGWAAGTLPAVCSSFIWLTAKNKGFLLEGPDKVVKSSELEKGESKLVEVGSSTLDGLYLYTATERLVAGENLFNVLVKNIDDHLEGTADVLDSTYNFFDHFDEEIAGQMLNAFAIDDCSQENCDSGAWRNAVAANAVSPDNILRWDAPTYGANGYEYGLYGATEKAIYRPASYADFYEWRCEKIPEKRGTVRVEVLREGKAEPGVTVKVSDRTRVTDATGKTVFELPVGNYQIQCTKTIDGLVWEAKSDSAKVGDKTEVTLQLNLTSPPAAKRLVKVWGDYLIFDDDDFGEDKKKGNFGAFQFNVAPDATKDYSGKNGETSRRVRDCAGGEVSLQVIFSVKLLSEGAIELTATAQCIESNECTYTDLDELIASPEKAVVTVKKGKTETFKMHQNNGDYDGDRYYVTLNVKNDQQG